MYFHEKIDSAPEKHGRIGMKAWPADGARHTYATAAGELHGFHRTAERMGHVGGLRVFLSHYRGRMSKAEATRYFQILPAPDQKRIIPFEAAG